MLELPFDFGWITSYGDYLKELNPGQNIGILLGAFHLFGSILLLIPLGLMSRLPFIGVLFRYTSLIILVAFIPNLIVGFAFPLLGVDMIKTFSSFGAVLCISALFSLYLYPHILKLSQQPKKNKNEKIES